MLKLILNLLRRDPQAKMVGLGRALEFAYTGEINAERIRLIPRADSSAQLLETLRVDLRERRLVMMNQLVSHPAANAFRRFKKSFRDAHHSVRR